MTSPSTSHPFVQFVHSLRDNKLIWQAISHICRDYSLNQNCILYCLWVAVSQQGRLRQFDLKRFEEMISPWHNQITNMLVSLENLVAKKSLNKEIHQEEFQHLINENIKFSEWVEQKMLAEGLTFCKQLTRNPKQQLGDACYNLMNYLKFQKINLALSDQEILQMILRTLFPSLSNFEVADAFDHAFSAHKLNQSYHAQLSLSNL